MDNKKFKFFSDTCRPSLIRTENLLNQINLCGHYVRKLGPPSSIYKPSGDSNDREAGEEPG